MKQKFSKFLSSEPQHSVEQQQTQQQQTAREFASPEELIRHDAAQVQPPVAIITRLKDSLAQDSPPRRSWWRRWFS